MIDLTLNQPLIASPAAEAGEISPGLMKLLRQIVAFRFIMTLLAAALAFIVWPLTAHPPVEARPLALFAAVESGLLLILVTVPPLRGRLGARFLPLALSWLLLLPVVQNALIASVAAPEVLESVGAVRFIGPGIDAIWAVVPVMLAAWQYGHRGWRISLAVLLAGQLLLALPLLGDAVDLGLYLVTAIGRLGVVALLSYVVMRMVIALRQEQEALVQANRQLAQRAATIEQLAESRERNRLARELHDTLAHSFSGLSVQLQALGTLLDRDLEAASSLLAEAQATVRSGLQEARRAIRALRAAPLEELGLSEALRQLCRQQAERTGAAITCEIADVGALDPLSEQSIYRVAEAALANIEQHAAAGAIGVSLRRDEDAGLRLVIRDDGAGFDVKHVPEDRYGLSGMRERAALIGAALRIESRPGQGTTVMLEARP